MGCNAAQFSDVLRVERLSLLAARLLDDSIGEHGRKYEFINYDPRDTRTAERVNDFETAGFGI
jgi:hypothetical protein